MTRKILVTGGDRPVHFVEHPADSEYELQAVLLNHPELIPAEDLGLEDDLLVVGRETALASGSIDLLACRKAVSSSLSNSRPDRRTRTSAPRWPKSSTTDPTCGS